MPDKNTMQQSITRLRSALRVDLMIALARIECNTVPTSMRLGGWPKWELRHCRRCTVRRTQGRRRITRSGHRGRSDGRRCACVCRSPDHTLGDDGRERRSPCTERLRHAACSNSGVGAACCVARVRWALQVPDRGRAPTGKAAPIVSFCGVDLRLGASSDSVCALFLAHVPRPRASGENEGLPRGSPRLVDNPVRRNLSPQNLPETKAGRDA